MLWYVVAQADSDYYTAYSSVWDKTNQPINYEIHPENHALLNRPLDQKVLHNLIFFADDYYTVTQTGNLLYFNIPRFEQVHGWQIPNAPFAFSYPLQNSNDQYMLLQKGRLTGWNKNSIKIYLQRIAGKQFIKQSH